MDLRRHSRVHFSEPVVVVVKGGDARIAGTSQDISLGGIFVEASVAPPFGSDVVVHLHIPGEREAMALPGVVRWVRRGGMGIQFGLLGARDTYAITELVSAVQSVEAAEEVA